MSKTYNFKKSKKSILEALNFTAHLYGNKKDSKGKPRRAKAKKPLKGSGMAGRQQAKYKVSKP